MHLGTYHIMVIGIDRCHNGISRMRCLPDPPHSVAYLETINIRPMDKTTVHGFRDHIGSVLGSVGHGRRHPACPCQYLPK